MRFPYWETRFLNTINAQSLVSRPCEEETEILLQPIVVRVPRRLGRKHQLSVTSTLGTAKPRERGRRQMRGHQATMVIVVIIKCPEEVRKASDLLVFSSVQWPEKCPRGIRSVSVSVVRRPAARTGPAGGQRMMVFCYSFCASASETHVNFIAHTRKLAKTFDFLWFLQPSITFHSFFFYT